MSQDRRSSQPHRRPSPTRRRPERRTTEREVVQSDELSSTNGARLISSENPYDPSMNPHASASFAAVTGAGAPHPKSPAGRALQQYEAERTGDIPRITVDSTLPPSYTGEQPAVGRDRNTAAPAHRTGGFSRVHGEGRASTTGSMPSIERTHTGSFRAVGETEAPAVSAGHTGRTRVVGEQAGQTGRTPRVAAHANQHPSSTGQHAPVMGTHTEPAADGTTAAAVGVGGAAGAVGAAGTIGATHKTGAIPVIEHLPDPMAPASNQQGFQDYSAESGRYQARPRVSAGKGGRGNHAGVLPVNAEAQHSPRRKSGKARIIGVAVAIMAVVAIVFGVNQAIYAGPIEATVNGEKMTLEGNQRSIAGLLDENVVSVTPGNYVAVDNSVIREGDGNRCTALINEQEVDLNGHINEGDSVVISNGNDIMEEFIDSAPTVLPAGYTREGDWGALHVFLPGQDGEMVKRTGSESGITVEQITKEKIDERLVYYNANTNGEKVVALTFDDGPWDGSTDEILDILKQNGAKATFYTIGEQVSAHSDQIKRMAAEGHEIATHTWDHAAGSGNGVSLDLMSTAERQTEVEKGLNIIKEIAGVDGSVYFRAPGGNFGQSTASDLMALIDGEIGWNIDTEDWRRPGAEVIAERIKSVQPGGIILMHDGGGDRSQTVAGLREALAYLKNQGYKFVTISELIEQYPYQSTSH